ncbi:MAG: GNAT family N-acetyltransferase [Bryobacteraceae bacterium]|nr:GNAT family N-acetyltransferase [Bryobacteraceae bacterium]
MQDLPILPTPRLSLRPWSERDLDALHTIFSNPGVRRYLCDDVILPRERIAAFIERSQRTAAANGIGSWGIYLQESDTMIGFCGFFFTEGTGELELLYGLLPEYWGQGIATEAARAALDYLWRATGFKRVFARADPPNRKSFEVMRRLGMRLHDTTPPLTSFILHRPAGLSSGQTSK